MKRTYLFAIAAGLILCVAIGYAKKRLNTFSHVETLGDTQFVELQLDLSIAQTSVRAGDPATLVDFSGEYSEDFQEPTMKVERSGEGKTYVYLESSDSKFNMKNHKDADGGNFDVLLSPTPEYAIKADVGLGENHIDLSGLKIKRFSLDAGLTETDLVLDKPNELEAERVDLESGLGSMDTDHLGYLRFRKLTVDCGMGDITLDFQGFEGEAMVDLSVGMGSCDILVPRGVGVRVYHDSGFMASVDLAEMSKTHKGIWETDDYEKAANKLEIDLSVGMGSVDLYWK